MTFITSRFEPFPLRGARNTSTQRGDVHPHLGGWVGLAYGWIGLAWVALVYGFGLFFSNFEYQLGEDYAGCSAWTLSIYLSIGVERSGKTRVEFMYLYIYLRKIERVEYLRSAMEGAV